MRFTGIIICLALAVLPIAAWAQSEKIDVQVATPTTESITPGNVTTPNNSPIGINAPEISETQVDTQETAVQENLDFDKRIWTPADSLNTALQGFAADSKRANAIDGFNNYQQGTFVYWGPFSLYGSNATDEHPGLMTSRAGALGMLYNTGGFTLQVQGNANRYLTSFGVTNQYGISGSMSYAFNPNVSFTVFGAFYGRKPFFHMATFPYVNTSAYGGYVNIENNKAGLKLGMARNFDPFTRKWIYAPIVTPTFKINKHVEIGIGIGGLFRDAANKWLRK